MAYNDQSLLRDKDGKPIPQVFDAITGTLVPLTTDMLDGGGGGGSGSGYGIIMNGNEMISAKSANDVLKVQAEGLSSFDLVPKVTGDETSRDVIKITTRFPTWDEIAGNQDTVFSPKDFVLGGDVIEINPVYKAGGGSGGGLPYINVMKFTVKEKDPVTGVEYAQTYCARGTSDPTTTILGDGTVVSDTIAFQKAFALAQKKSNEFPAGQGSVNIYIPDGIYILTGTITMFRNTNVQASRNAIVKKNHSGVMFCNTDANDAYLGYEGGRHIKQGLSVDMTKEFTPNNGNIFFDGGTFDNDGTSGSVFSIINARNFEFKNLTVLDILDSHAFDIDGIADVIIYNCSFLGYDYRGSRNRIIQGYTSEATIDPTTIRAYSECIQIDYSTLEAFPAQKTGHDGTACKRIRVDKCVFGPSNRFPAWNRAFGGHNTYVPTYDWLYNISDGTPKGTVYNFKDNKATDMYFLNNVVIGNGTLKYDYDDSDPQGFIIQQVRMQGCDNVIVMNNKFRDCKGGISIDIDSSPKTMLSDALHKNFVTTTTTGTTGVPASGVMPAKVTYFDSHGDIQEIWYTSNPADIDLNKVTTHKHENITYTIYWCNQVKMMEYYGWKNAMIMNNELTNVTSGVWNYRQVTATTATSPATNKIIVQDIYLLGNQVITPGTEIYIKDPTVVDANFKPVNSPNPVTVTSIVGTPSVDEYNNPITVSPYTVTYYPPSSALQSSDTAIFIKKSIAKSASTPIYLRGKMSPYKTVNYTAATNTFKTATGGQADTYGKNAIVYGNIVDGCDQISVYSTYQDVILNGRKATYIKNISTDRLTITLNAITDPWFLVGENVYYGIAAPDFTNPYRITAVNIASKTITLDKPLVANAGKTSSDFIWSRKPILAGQTGGPGIITAISAQWVNDVIIQKNIVRNVPRAVYINGGENKNVVNNVTYVTPVGQRTSIIGNQFYKINEVEAVCIDTGNYVNIIGNIMSDLNDQAIDLRDASYFNISNNEILNFNQGGICKSPVSTVVWDYDPLVKTPVIEIYGDGVTTGKYGNLTGNLFVHKNTTPVDTGIFADSTTSYIKMANNSYPSEFSHREVNNSDVGTNMGYRGNDADTLQGKTIGALKQEDFVAQTEKGVAYGVATLDKDGRVVSTQLPAGSSGAGFKTITITDLLGNQESVIATPLANTLNLQGTNGIALDVKEGNVIEIKSTTGGSSGNTGFDEIYLDNGKVVKASDATYIGMQGGNGITIDVSSTDNNILKLDFDANGAWDGRLDGVESHVTALPPHVSTNDRTNWDGKLSKNQADNSYLQKTANSGKQTVENDAQFNKRVSLTNYDEYIGVVASGLCDLNSGSIFNVSVDANTTIMLMNPTVSAAYVQSVVLYLKMNGSYSVTFPKPICPAVANSEVKWHEATTPTFASGKTYEVILRTTNAGLTWFASVGGSF